MELHVLCGRMRGCVDDTGVTENLVDDCIHVWHGMTINKLWCSAAYDTVYLLLHTSLHLWESGEIVEGKGEDSGGGL